SVKAIYSLNIMQGQLGQYGVSFNPNANINRMEFAIALNRLLPKGLKSEPIYSADKDDIPFWAEDSMRVIFAQGIMTGYPDGTLRPTQSVTRAEGVKMLFNIIGAGK
ncbi:MAG: S-layer homology domain-containing protein, partial [Monoglobaceae bacterium]